MAEGKRVIVVGLGRFGMSTARTLADTGYEVTAVDIAEKAVAEAASHVTLAAEGDGTDEELLRSLGADRCEFGVVGQGENLEVSVLSTLVLKRLGIPWVVAKATSHLHGELLHRIGADRVVYPERDAGVRLGHTISIRHLDDYIPLSPYTGVAKIIAPRHFIGKTLEHLCADHADRLTVLLLRRASSLIAHPDPNEQIQEGDQLLVVGADAEIDEFASPDRDESPK